MNTIYKDKDWLYEQYIVLGRTIESIYKECGVSHHTIETYLKKYNIRKTPKSPKLPTKSELTKLHHEDACGIYKIASFYPGVGVSTILKLMQQYNIKILTAEELKRAWWRNPENRNRMSDLRLRLWKDDEYAKKTSAHLYDPEAIRERSIKYSATYQGVSLENWAGFLTPIMTRARNCSEYSRWRTAVFERDGYICQCCGAKSYSGHPVTLHAHHIDGFAGNERLRYDVDNGITLCSKCHDIRAEGSFHNIYGVHNNTRAQFVEYMSMVSKEKKGVVYESKGIG